MRKSFFSEINRSWDGYHGYRSKYYDKLPVPQASYFHPIRTIDTCAEILVRPIANPLWFAVHTGLFFLKAALHLLATALLLIPVVIAAIVAPKTDLFTGLSNMFKVQAAETIVAATMTFIAACGTVASLFLNPLYLLTRAACTVLDKINDVTEGTIGLTIVKF